MKVSALVSVVVPAYQAADYITETLTAILAQDHPNFEVVVLDNASTDGTGDIVQAIGDPRVRLARSRHLVPMAENWRRATQLAHGEYIKLVCADDLIYPRSLSIQSEVLDTRPDVALVACRRDLVDDRGRVRVRGVGLYRLIGQHTGRHAARMVVRLSINPIGEPAAIMFRRSDYEAVGGWSREWVFALDIDLWMKLLTRGDLVGLPESMAAFRLSTTSLSSWHNASQKDEHRRFVKSVADDPRWNISKGERIASAFTSPLAWGAWAVRQKLLWRRRPDRA